MGKRVKKKRPYNSKIRVEQAAQTRARILDAAEELFLANGYARTPVRAIAEAAGVVPDTVYATFGNKARVLTALIDRRLVPDASVERARDRLDAQAFRAEPDQRRQLQLFAEFIAGISTNLRPIFEILRTASAVEPEAGAVFREMDNYRLQNMYVYAEWIGERGPLLGGVRRAGEVMWALGSPDVGRMLCDELNWTQAQHAEWLADALIRTLLPDNPKE